MQEGTVKCAAVANFALVCKMCSRVPTGLTPLRAFARLSYAYGHLYIRAARNTDHTIFPWKDFFAVFTVMLKLQKIDL